MSSFMTTNLWNIEVELHQLPVRASHQYRRITSEINAVLGYQYTQEHVLL